MKRPIATTLGVIAFSALSACSEATAPIEEATRETGWVMPPVVDTATASGRDLVVSGFAAPLGRVVVRGAGDLAYAVGTDEQGRFDLRVPRPSRDTVFTVEARQGQTAYPAPYRLLIGADPQAPVALLAIGAPTRRLDGDGGLDAVDTDGRATFLSGRATAGATVRIEGMGSRTTSADDQGRWRIAGAGDGASPIVVDGVAHTPAPGSGDAVEGGLERAGAGWRITWSSPGAGRQSTWFPDRPERGDVAPTIG